MKTITIHGRLGQSHIHVGEKLENAARYIPAEKYLIVTDRNVRKIHGHRFPVAQRSRAEANSFPVCHKASPPRGRRAVRRQSVSPGSACSPDHAARAGCGACPLTIRSGLVSLARRTAMQPAKAGTRGLEFETSVKSLLSSVHQQYGSRQ